MSPSHKAWLSSHPKRSAAWLAERIADGFHVHHLDLDHDNNDPRNLVLVEGVDHRKFHPIPIATYDDGRVIARVFFKEGQPFMEWAVPYGDRGEWQPRIAMARGYPNAREGQGANQP